MKEQIIKYIESEKLSSVEVADALGKKGVIEGVKTIGKTGKQAIGEIYYVYAYDKSNYHMHQQIVDAPEDSIVFIEHWNSDKPLAILGDLTFEYLFKYKKVKSVVVNGYIRDVHETIKKNQNVWATGTTPLGVENKYIPIPRNIDVSIQSKKKKLNSGILIADDNGVVVIEPNECNESFLGDLQGIKKQEELWYESLKKGMNTFEIVCEKKYLD